MDRKFYRNVFTVTVLSEDEPLSEVDLEQIAYEVTEGRCALHSFNESAAEVDGPTMARLLAESGSAPEFFSLSEDGHPTEGE